jgi:hypothetical protein
MSIIRKESLTVPFGVGGGLPPTGEDLDIEADPADVPAASMWDTPRFGFEGSGGLLFGSVGNCSHDEVPDHTLLPLRRRPPGSGERDLDDIETCSLQILRGQQLEYNLELFCKYSCGCLWDGYAWS